MKFYAINGSPRLKCNTAKLLDKSLEGVKSVLEDAETQRIDLYKLSFTGCKSCFACKRLDGRHYGECAVKDDLKPILEEISQADGIIFASPIYFSNVTGVMRCFIERLSFPYFVYDDGDNIAPKRMPTAFIYTMNVSKDVSKAGGYDDIYDKNEIPIESVFSKPLRYCAYDTYQFRDYSKYKMEVFSEEEKRKALQTQFPKDLENAFEIGCEIATRAAQHD